MLLKIYLNHNKLIKLYFIFFVLLSFSILSDEITDSYSFPGGKLIRTNGIWEEIKANSTIILNESGRDRDWILLFDSNKKILYNLPSKGGQAYWTNEFEKNKWKPWLLVKREINSKDESLLTLCINSEESKLVRLITQYRISLNLTPIQLSSSLTTLAKTHLKDLEENPPTIECSPHSWSKKGNWTPCCYTDNLVSRECMYYKAKEIVDYKENSFEIFYFEHEDNVSLADKSLKSWKLNNEINYMITNQFSWKNLNWKSMGIAISKRYSILWLGTEKDTKDIPGLCN